MGLTKQYLRYVETEAFGVVGSEKSNVIFLDMGGFLYRYCAVGACENVLIWDMRKGEKLLTLAGDKHQVSRLAKSPDTKHLAVGYNNGMVRIFNLGSGDSMVTFSGHKSAVSALSYDKDGVRLVSGSKDTDVVVWDTINESGLFRLKGHKAVVTQALFLQSKNILITSSKDTFIKLWDLDTQHCFKTIVEHKTEVWDFTLIQDKYLVSGAGDSELRVWSIFTEDMPSEPPIKRIKRTESVESEDDNDDVEDETIVCCIKVGSIMRKGRDRVLSIQTDPANKLLACHGTDKMLEVFSISTEDEVQKLVHKRQKKARKKARESGIEESTITIEKNLKDEIRKLFDLTMNAKLKAFDIVVSHEGQAKIITLLNNNVIEMYGFGINDKNTVPQKEVNLSGHGHRSDVRTLSFSSDSIAIMSASAETIKVWNRNSLQCIRTLASGYALCSLFAPGDRQVMIGTKAGKIELYDLASGHLFETIEAHDGAVWSLCMAPDKKGIVSGSADHLVKFWNFELISDKLYTESSKRLTVVHTRTLKMSEDVLCVKYSPSQRLLAVALLDNTVKVFFTDTLKFFLSLYGHKLPVLCMDISTDNSLIVTGSADRNVKLWGLDFGDCHKSIFAHDDSIMCVQFVPKTHMFFTGGKDGKLKEWNADTFDHIQTLEGHHGEIWSLAVSPSGNFIVTASHDKSIRLWEKTQEPLILDEEREIEREKEQDEALGQGEEPVVAGEKNPEAGFAGKKTTETVKAAERLMEAIELYKQENSKYLQLEMEAKATKREELIKKIPLHPMFLAYKVTTPERYFLEVLKKVKSSELEEALLVLPFPYVIDLIILLNQFIKSEWEVELSCRCVFFLLRIHQGQITSSPVLLPALESLNKNIQCKVSKLRDTVGFNLAGLKVLKQQIEEEEEVMLFTDATDAYRQKRKKTKKKTLLTIRS